MLFGTLALVTWNFWQISTASVFYVALFIAMGIPAVAAGTGALTTVQQAAPPEALGRTFASMQTSMQAGQGVGVLLAGVIADLVGVVPVLDAQASIYLLCGVAGLILLRPRGGDSIPHGALGR